MFGKNCQLFSPIQLYTDLIGVGYAFILLAAGAAMLERILNEVYTMVEATGDSTVTIIEALTEQIVE
ncbi:hypothetical protein [uncultured Methanomethylovorans sp.]|jgi:hypothetical protein|uniref:hypothetical protein n=1 Tax=uncultured Methanomethylovorans sp. TaxID=183759 RepID=UPI002AA66A95|nr:hypothetical protein [uncultured Methanomethylovorans sp.]